MDNGPDLTNVKPTSFIGDMFGKAKEVVGGLFNGTTRTGAAVADAEVADVLGGGWKADAAAAGFGAAFKGFFGKDTQQAWETGAAAAFISKHVGNFSKGTSLLIGAAVGIADYMTGGKIGGLISKINPGMAPAVH